MMFMSSRHAPQKGGISARSRFREDSSDDYLQKLWNSRPRRVEEGVGCALACGWVASPPPRAVLPKRIGGCGRQSAAAGAGAGWARPGRGGGVVEKAGSARREEGGHGCGCWRAVCGRARPRRLRVQGRRAWSARAERRLRAMPRRGAGWCRAGTLSRQQRRRREGGEHAEKGGRGGGCGVLLANSASPPKGDSRELC